MDDIDAGTAAPKWTNMMNGDILVCTTKDNGEGNSHIAVSLGSVLLVDMVGFLLLPNQASASADENKVSETDEPAGEPFEKLTAQRLQIGESDTIPALELALRHARVGQRLTVRCSSKYAFGPDGRSGAGKEQAGSVPPNSNVQYDLHVRAIQELELLELDEKQRQDAATVAVNTALQGTLLRRECGNRWYHHGQFKQAARSYSKGIEISSESLQTKSTTGDDASLEKLFERANEARISCLNNLCACQISLAEYSKAKELCVSILQIDPKNIRALLRAARVALALHSYEECEACIASVLELEPENELALIEQKKLRRAKAEYNAASKKLAKRMFAEKEKPDASKRASKEVEATTGSPSPEREQEREQEQERGRGRGPVEHKERAKAAQAVTEAEGNSNLLLLLVTAVVVLIAAVLISKVDTPREPPH